MRIPGVNWVDLNKGQVGSNAFVLRPSIDFPAILLNISFPRTSKLNRRDQQCEVTIETTIVFDFMDDTNSITPDDILQKSLEVYDLLDLIHGEMQGLMDVEVIRSPLQRTGVRDVQRSDMLKTFVAVYTTSMIQ
ncbi:hypothetical protein [Sphingobacterium hotanense]|uniref:Uncharacterized protein n=1 Tax=Sphingobacterium hotanense TaxID=649196 RepID=A0ABT7NLM6_9SPHI|nr:hypothetical protein [Sphingobacterium hotanense]MDM1048046.1 hypothetical protein [Sphingobacterium hotanense]